MLWVNSLRCTNRRGARVLCQKLLKSKKHWLWWRRWCWLQLRNPAGRHFLKEVLQRAIPLLMVCMKALVPRHGLLACVLQVGLRYDMMELTKHLNAENKVSNEDKRENTYRVPLSNEGL